MTTTQSGMTNIVQRGKTDDNILPNKTGLLVKISVPFPNNHGKLLPSEYYHQFREWYAVFLTMKIERNTEQTTWI